MAQVIVSREARTDLEKIDAYIRDELQNPDAAVKLMAELKQKIQSLQEFPERGALLNVMPTMESGYRFLRCGTYLVFYQVIGQQVEVVRIKNSRENYLKVLFP